ncbi:hypothetical protein EVAR_75690_1 [Eumeta japonica]|uniref:Uncharacterized protein n=1 Tax=Eumeta variegata TaxID=151549 RepID=A0A4C1W2P5_EUMVA|nr:hypothetical protein EVAR_75690_1 [Eumeta japonica]
MDRQTDIGVSSSFRRVRRGAARKRAATKLMASINNVNRREISLKRDKSAYGRHHSRSTLAEIRIILLYLRPAPPQIENSRSTSGRTNYFHYRRCGDPIISQQKHQFVSFAYICWE